VAGRQLWRLRAWHQRGDQEVARRARRFRYPAEVHRNNPSHGYRFMQPVLGFADAETVLGTPPRQRLKARRVGLR